MYEQDTSTLFVQRSDTNHTTSVQEMPSKYTQPNTKHLCSSLTMHLPFLLLRHSLIPLPAKSVQAPITARNIMRIEIIQIPPHTPKEILARLKQHIHLAPMSGIKMVDILLHVERRISRSDNRTLGFEQQRQRLFPFVHGSRVAETGVETDEAVEIGVVGVEVACFMHGVVVVDKGAYFQGVADAVFDDGAEGIEGRARGERELGFAVRHGFGADEVDGELHAVEEVHHLHPHFAWERGFGTSAEDEETDRGRG
jgi:hypothetical protein